MHKLLLILFVFSLVAPIAVAEEKAPDEFLSANDLWSLLEDDPGTYHDQVLVFGRYLDEMQKLAQIPKPSQEQSEILQSLLSPVNLKKFRKAAVVILDMYKDDPEENPEGRRRDLRPLEFCVKRFSGILQRLDDVKRFQALQKPIKEAIEHPSSAPRAQDMLYALKDKGLLSSKGKSRIIQRYLDEFNAFKTIKEPSKAQLLVLQDLTNGLNLVHVKKQAEELLSVAVKEEPVDDELVTTLNNQIESLTELIEAAGPLPYRKVNAQESKAITAYLAGFREMLKNQKYMQVAKNELLIVPAPRPEAFPLIAKKLARNSTAYIALINSLLANKANWFIAKDEILLIQSKSEWTSNDYRVFILVTKKRHKLICKKVSSHLQGVIAEEDIE